MRVRLRTAAAILLLAAPCSAARLSAPARQAFDNYAAAVENRLAQQHASPDTYLAVFKIEAQRRADALHKLRSGEMLVEPVNGGTREVGGALLHHWRGTAFVPGARAKEMVALLRDYNQLASYYAPEIQSSQVVSERPGNATVTMRIRKQKVVTVVLDTEYEVRAVSTGASGYSFSRSNHIWQVANAGEADERRLPEGNDDGFLWRLNSYWSFVELPDGLLIECEAISLTRDVPTGLGWLIAPIVESMPRESMTFTLGATSKALSSIRLERADHERRMQDASEGINARR